MFCLFHLQQQQQLLWNEEEQPHDDHELRTSTPTPTKTTYNISSGTDSDIQVIGEVKVNCLLNTMVKRFF